MRRLLLAGLLAATVASWAGDAWLRVTVVGLRHERGNLLVSLYNRPEGFPGQPEKAYRKMAVPVASAKEVVFEDLPEGTYAVAVCHDENGSMALETGLFGKPKEGTGASNDPPHRWRPPRFEEARFALQRPGKALTVKVVY